MSSCLLADVKGLMTLFICSGFDGLSQSFSLQHDKIENIFPFVWDNLQSKSTKANLHCVCFSTKSIIIQYVSILVGMM